MSNNSVELPVCILLQSQTLEDIQVTNRNIMALLPLIYAIPSILLTIRLVLFLIKSRKQENFSGSFYKLFIIASFVVGKTKFAIGNCFFRTYFIGYLFIVLGLL